MNVEAPDFDAGFGGLGFIRVLAAELWSLGLL